MRHTLARLEDTQSPLGNHNDGTEPLQQQRTDLVRALAAAEASVRTFPRRRIATGQSAGTGHAPAERIETLESHARHGQATSERGRLPDRDVPRARFPQRMAVHRRQGATPPRFKSCGTSHRTARCGAWSAKLI